MSTVCVHDWDRFPQFLRVDWIRYPLGDLLDGTGVAHRLLRAYHLNAVGPHIHPFCAVKCVGRKRFGISLLGPQCTAVLTRRSTGTLSMTLTPNCAEFLGLLIRTVSGERWRFISKISKLGLEL